MCSYDHSHEPEYFAFRHSAGLLDVSPLNKYEVHGPDAALLLSRMTVRDATRLAVGRVAYCCWCDDQGKVIDDGTISRLEPEHFRLTAAEPTGHWLQRLSRGLRVKVEDSTRSLAALALQGPTSRDILKACSDADMDGLKFFGITSARLDGEDVWISRTGYTGDLGFEIWCRPDSALPVWDAIVEAGRSYGLVPAGLDALDMARIEAGFLLLGVDYYGAHQVIQEFRKSSPFEIGLGWMVDLDRDGFVGQAALRREKQNGSPWQFVGLELSWEELEALYERYGLPPNLPARASRSAIPVYAEDRQVGQATSHTWSPTLKKSLALASVRTPDAEPGRKLQIEHTVEFERCKVSATVVKLPFLDPPRKRK